MALKKLSPEALRQLRRVGMFAGAGVLVYVVALFIWFPYDRAKEVAIGMAAAQGLDVEIESAGPTFGIGVSFSNIRVKTRPTSGKPTRFSIEKASVTTSLFGLLFSPSSPPLTISLDAFGGHVELSQKGSPGKKGPFRIELVARGVEAGEIPGVRETINLPLTGTLKLDLDLASATGRFATSKGTISFSCEGCVAGDGKAPLKVEGNPFLGGGLTLPKVRIGDLRGEVAVDNGTAKLKGIESKSPDGELSLEGDVSLRDPLMNSIVNAYLRFKLSDAFLKSASTVQTILQMAGGNGRRPDGSYGLRIGGRLGAPAMSLASSSPFGASAGAAARPGVGVRPGMAPSYVPPPPPPASGQQPPSTPPATVDNSPPPPPQPPPVPDVQMIPPPQATEVRPATPPPVPVVDQPTPVGPDATAAPAEEAQ
jgi:type II secretion system protein N